MYSKVKDLIAAVFLIFTVFCLLATSAPFGQLPVSGSHWIISDCVTPVTKTAITVVDGSITEPVGVSFMDFGFPAAKIDATVSGIVNGKNRECLITYGDDGSEHDFSDHWLYSCFDNGDHVCSIYIKPR